jgi:hypothetical protein
VPLDAAGFALSSGSSRSSDARLDEEMLGREERAASSEASWSVAEEDARDASSRESRLARPEEYCAGIFCWKLEVSWEYSICIVDNLLFPWPAGEGCPLPAPTVLYSCYVECDLCRSLTMLRPVYGGEFDRRVGDTRYGAT